MNEKLFAATTKTFEKGDVYPGYPTVRLVAAGVTVGADGSLVLPNGEWTKNNTNLPTPDETEAFRLAGYDTDSEGRPLHPWLHEMLANPDLGVVTGKGNYWDWGPNKTADPVVLTKEERPSVLLIKRVDTGKWALPGGFIDKGERDPYEATTRELYEETNLDIPVQGELIYQDVVADLRTTAHAWAETSAYSFVVDKPLPVMVTDPEEVEEVCWFSIDDMPEPLHGSHAVLIDMAVERLKNPARPTIKEILNKPKDQLEITTANGGHMTYDHLIIRDGNERLFVKAHDASQFTDTKREKSSRFYLIKEKVVYQEVAEQGFTAIPDRVELIDDSLLAMDALYEGDGWQWRAPESEQFADYTRDILSALDQLQALPIPENPEYHTLINTTYETFWREGWDDITDDNIDAIIAKIIVLSKGWDEARRRDTSALIRDLPQLRSQAAVIDRHPTMYKAHNDARQSNIAWHPEHGAKIVDWSWADPAPRNADSTMLLVDLVKSGYEVNDYIDHVNKDQLIVYIGFLLAHSVWETRDGSMTVREQQVASASAAYQLLQRLPHEG